MIDTEAYLLGCFILYSDLSPKLLVINPSYFSIKEHEYIFEAILNLYKNNTPIDLLSVSEELQRQNKLDAVGGVTYLMKIVESVPNSVNFDYHLKRFIENGKLRTSLLELSEIINHPPISLEELQENLSKVLDNATPYNQERDSGTVLQAVFQSIADRTFEKKNFSFIQTGYEAVDAVGLFSRGELSVIGGRPSKGKTAFLINLFYRFIQNNYRVLFFTYETSPNVIFERMFAISSGIKYRNIRMGLLSESEYQHLVETVSSIYDKKDYFSVLNVDLEEIPTHVKEFKPDIILLDYIQVVRTQRNFKKRLEEIDYIIDFLKNLAVKNNLLLISTSQLNREAEKLNMQYGEYTLMALRESGKIEQVADTVSFIQDDRSKDSNPTTKYLDIKKNREGALAKIPFLFYQDILKFEEVPLYEI
ncbi:MAG: replicative DNA helicase [Conexivisphaerales archaeon]